jgi:hypothetical protein
MTADLTVPGGTGLSHAADAAPTAIGDACIFVVGMHRSGTSATTGLLCELGLGAPRKEVSLNATPVNEKGFFEAKILNRFDERLLAHLGGSWSSPPVLEPGWERDEALAPWKAEAADLFAQAFGPRPIVWKDPRSSILLAFWRSVVKAPVAAVLVWRDPYEVASSLNTRDGLRVTHGFAIWERYLRQAAKDLDGVPTYCTSYSSMLEAPADTASELISFLGNVGVSVDPLMVSQASGFLDTGLRHERATQNDRDIPASVRYLEKELEGLKGPHLPWVAPTFESEPAWVGDTIAVMYELANMRKAKAELYDARPMRWARAADGLVQFGKRSFAKKR